MNKVQGMIGGAILLQAIALFVFPDAIVTGVMLSWFLLLYAAAFSDKKVK